MALQQANPVMGSIPAAHAVGAPWLAHGRIQTLRRDRRIARSGFAERDGTVGPPLCVALHADPLFIYAFTANRQVPTTVVVVETRVDAQQARPAASPLGGCDRRTTFVAANQRIPRSTARGLRGDVRSARQRVCSAPAAEGSLHRAARYAAANRRCATARVGAARVRRARVLFGLGGVPCATQSASKQRNVVPFAARPPSAGSDFQNSVEQSHPRSG